MDPVTHGFLGANLRNLGAGRRRALYVLVISAMFADIDYLFWLGGAESFMRLHRGLTHSIFAMVLVPLFIAALASRLKKDFGYYYLLGVVGYASHIALDLTNAYGVRFLAPLDWRSYSLDIVFVLDPLISGAFFAAVLWAAYNKKQRRTALVAALAAALVVSYIGVRYYFHERAEAFLKGEMSDYRIHRVVPQPGDIMGWWFVASGRDDIRVGYADLYTKHVSVHRTYPAQSMDPVIEATRGLDVVKTFLGFSLTPYAEIHRTPEGTTVLWRELAYTFIPGEHFAARVELDRKGRVLKREIIY